MRLPFPTRIPVFWAALFAVGMLIVQQFQHTGFGFSLLFLAFVMLSTATFNLAGGLSRPSGAYVLFFALLTCVFGVFWKAVTGEAADSNLLAPDLTMAAYVGSMLSMMGVIYVIRHLLKDSISFSARIGANDLDFGDAALGCLVVGVLLDVINSSGLVPSGNGSLLTAINHINFFYPVATILGTLVVIRSSGGRRSIGFVNGVAIAMQLFSGFTGFSKQAMFTPLVCWAIAAASLRLRLTRVRLVTIGLTLFVVSHYLVPLSQVGREMIYDGESQTERLATAVALLEHPVDLRKSYQFTLDAATESAVNGFKIGYYDSAQGFGDRLNMIYIDDQMIAYTDRGHVEGLGPLEFDFINLVPHFILPQKEKLDVAGGQYANHGNYYAHELGTIADADTSTGISFSSTAEAFHLGSWLGIFLLAPLIWGGLFFISDSMYGDPRRSPWALFLLLYFAHSAPEGSLGATVGGLEVTNISLLAIMIFCLQFAPITGALLAGNLGRRGPAMGAGRTATAIAAS